MKHSIYLFTFAVLFFNVACNQNNKMESKRSKMYSNTDIISPKAEINPKELTMHGDTRMDNYYWMRLSDEQKNAKVKDTQTQKVIDYLNTENTYKDSMLSHTTLFQEKLFDEIVGRIKQTDLSVPYMRNGYYYYTRFEEGKEHPIYCRKESSLENKEEILLNANELAEGYDYYKIGGMSVSPNNKLLIYAEDTLSRRIYTLKIKNLETGEIIGRDISETSGNGIWANDNKTIFYTGKDEKTLRSDKIYRHELNELGDDVLLFEEKDDTFYSFVYKTKSNKYIIIGSAHTLSNEYHYLNADTPQGEFKLFEARDTKANLEYGITHIDNKWYIRTNLDAKNFRLMETAENATSKENWKEVIPNRPDVLLEGMDIFKDYLVLSERKNGITQLRVRPWQGKEYYIKFSEEAYLTYTSSNFDLNTNILRFGYQSMTTPNSIYDYNMNTKERILLKQQEVVGDFRSEDYVSNRVMVTARDGAKVPVSIVYKKDTKIDGTAPCLLYGYGSYGNSMEPYFSSTRLSLLDRGFVYAIAHIRGGQEMGRQWYEDGKLLKKKNTFYDFIDCGEYLVKHKYAAKDELFAMGGSAGGLLVGAVINMKPSLWKGAIAAVPFVDVVSTMMDESIPLTTFEFDEWGNPKDKTYYDYIKSYSPYDNVEAKDYPALLVTTGLFDSQVQYWEPAKWVAKLRELKTDKNPLLMYVNMDTGHGGAAGRFERHKETAMEYAFLLDLAGYTE